MMKELMARHRGRVDGKTGAGDRPPSPVRDLGTTGPPSADEIEVKIPAADLRRPCDPPARGARAPSVEGPARRVERPLRRRRRPISPASGARFETAARRQDARILTFKGPARFEKGVKTREERETVVARRRRDGGDPRGGSGFDATFRYEKRREEWRFADCVDRARRDADRNVRRDRGRSAGDPPAVAALALDFAAAIPYSYAAALRSAGARTIRRCPTDMVFDVGDVTGRRVPTPTRTSPRPMSLPSRRRTRRAVSAGHRADPQAAPPLPERPARRARTSTRLRRRRRRAKRASISIISATRSRATSASSRANFRSSTSSGSRGSSGPPAPCATPRDLSRRRRLSRRQRRRGDRVRSRTRFSSAPPVAAAAPRRSSSSRTASPTGTRRFSPKGTASRASGAIGPTPLLYTGVCVLVARVSRHGSPPARPRSSPTSGSRSSPRAAGDRLGAPRRAPSPISAARAISSARRSKRSRALGPCRRGAGDFDAASRRPLADAPRRLRSEAERPRQARGSAPARGSARAPSGAASRSARVPASRAVSPPAASSRPARRYEDVLLWGRARRATPRRSPRLRARRPRRIRSRPSTNFTPSIADPRAGSRASGSFPCARRRARRPCDRGRPRGRSSPAWTPRWRERADVGTVEADRIVDASSRACPTHPGPARRRPVMMPGTHVVRAIQIMRAPIGPVDAARDVRACARRFRFRRRRSPTRRARPAMRYFNPTLTACVIAYVRAR